MKKFYSLVLMAAALLIGTNVWAGNVAKIGATEYATLEAAWADVQDGQTIELIADCNPTKTLWLGTETMADQDHVKSITLNLGTSQDPHNIAFDFKVSKPAFFITHGSLNITGTGTISLGSVGEGGYSLKAQTVGGVQTTNASHWVVFQVTGSTYKTVDPSDKDADHYTHLTIGSGVTIDCQGVGIVVDRLVGSAKAHQWPLDSDPTGKYAAVATSGVDVSAAPFNTTVYSGRGTAYGVRVDLEGHIIAGKYGIKANTELAGPSSTPKADVSGYVVNFDENGDPIAYSDATKAFDKTYSPYINIHDGATVTEVNTTTGGIGAVYSGGYARWHIEGDCKGSTGAFIKSGEVVVAGDATIESNYANAYTAGGDSGLDRGFEGGGSGLVVVSSDLGVGDTKVTITDDATIKGATGYAIEEGISTSDGHSEVESIAIQGGTIEQGANGQGIITVTTETRGSSTTTSTTVSISGGTFEGDENGVTLGAQTLQEFLETQREGGQDTHGVIVSVDPVTGEQTVVISAGPAPLTATSVIGTADGKSCNWISTEDVTETLTADKTLSELQITSADYNQTLIVSDGVTLTVDRVVLGPKAQIVVKAGGKFIVAGEQGLAAFQERNLVLENAPGKRSIFLFHPDVTSNTHPKATFELLTNSWYDASKTPKAQPEVFAIPTNTAITNIACKETGKYGYIQAYQNGGWVNIDYTDAASFPYNKLNQPFGAYAVTAYRTEAEDPLTIQLSGELYGNSDASLKADWQWSFFANSYTAEVDLAQFLAALNANAQNVTRYIYMYEVEGQGYWHWRSYDSESLGDEGVPTKLQPMQGFILNNTGSQIENHAINYETMVYAPAVPTYNSSNPAPRRSVIANDITSKLYVNVTSEDGLKDYVTLREAATTKFAEKYMNDDVNIYAMTEKKSSIFATEDLENTYLGFSSLNGGTYTISFTNVQGREFTLIDHETGARVAAEEGNTYRFTAAANSVNDYRFEIVASAKMPTAIENTEAVKSVKGIYTITGQYVGEMSVWNSLPAGIYVVNGEKRVK